MPKGSSLYALDLKAPTHLQGSKSQHLVADRADPVWMMQTRSVSGHPPQSLWLMGIHPLGAPGEPRSRGTRPREADKCPDLDPKDMPGHGFSSQGSLQGWRKAVTANAPWEGGAGHAGAAPGDASSPPAPAAAVAFA